MSVLWQYVQPDTGKRWHCENHMCMSPFFQWSWDEWPVCNGCLVKANAPGHPAMDVVANTLVEVHPSDYARDLQPIQRGIQ